MDIPRKSASRNRRIRRIIYGVTTVAAVGLITLGVSRLKPASPSVPKNTVWIDTVKRGTIPRQVRGLGTLVPEEIRMVPASSQGRVEKKLLMPGATVKADTIIMELSNPEVEQAALDAESRFRAAESNQINLRVNLEKQVLDQESTVAQSKSSWTQAKMTAEVFETLAQQGLKSSLEAKVQRMQATDLENRFGIEVQRLAKTKEQAKAQIDADRENISQLKDAAELRRKQVNDLKVRAGLDGVLQLVQVEVGQQVSPGANLARVANPARLKAELKVPETQAKDVQPGQSVLIDTRNGVVSGKVSRVAPSSENGTVTVDATIEGDLPKGARPDLSVDGTIELERLENVLYVGRPVQGQEKSTVGLFKLEDGGQSATRVQVKLGRSSVNLIELLEGLKEGDQVILSDTSAYDNTEHILLN